jgi:hypothetical protein
MLRAEQRHANDYCNVVVGCEHFQQLQEVGYKCSSMFEAWITCCTCCEIMDTRQSQLHPATLQQG